MIKVRKDNPKKFKPINAKSGVPPEQLQCANAIRKTVDSKNNQYRLILEDGSVKEFRNFKELRYFISSNLRKSPTFIKLSREGNKVTPVNFFTYQQ